MNNLKWIQQSLNAPKILIGTEVQLGKYVHYSNDLWSLGSHNRNILHTMQCSRRLWVRESGHYYMWAYLSFIQHKILEIVCNPKITLFSWNATWSSCRDFKVLCLRWIDNKPIGGQVIMLSILVSTHSFGVLNVMFIVPFFL